MKSEQRQASGTLRRIALGLMGLGAGLPAAAIAQLSPFQIDANVPDAAAVQFPDPYGGDAELGPVNSNQTKLNAIGNATLPMLEFTNPNVATDLVNIWLDVGEDPSGDVWLYFAWEREPSNGSSVISYEFQAAAPDPSCNYAGIDQIEPEDPAETDLINTCNPWSNRQAGDFMVVWDFDGTVKDPLLRVFDGNAFGDGINLADFGSAEAIVNLDKTRGEGAVNLTDVIFGELNQCFAIANVIPGTITGNSDQADYKDTVLADISAAITISNCGTVNVTKETVPSGESGSFGYMIEREGGGVIDYDASTSISGVLEDDGATDQLLLLPGNDYLLTEDQPGALFDADEVVCDRPGPVTAGSDTTGFSVAISDTTNCLITNTLRVGTLSVRKEVVNQYGDPAPASAFCVDLGGTTDTPVFAADSTGVERTFLDGTLYNVSEVACGDPDTSPGGYIASYELFLIDSATGGRQSLGAGCSSSIAAYEDHECVITNTMQPQDQVSLTLFKNLVNDNGGKAQTTDWTLSALLKDDAPGVCTSGGVSGVDGGTGVPGSVSITDSLAQCAYLLSESGNVPGYTASNWTCSGGNFSLNGNELIVGAGDPVACTITNDDIPPSLTLVKEITNDNGGTAAASDFVLSASGETPTPLSGAGGASSDETFWAGSYALSEQGPSGYAASEWSCVGGTQSGASISLALGEQASCTIANDDIAPSLTLVKNVVNDNGGTAVAADFMLTADGPTSIAGAGGASSDDTFSAGVYALSEQGPEGYSTDGFSCVGGTQSGASISLALGESATCTIVNDDIAPSLTLVKNVVNDNGGTAVAADFMLSAAGPTSIAGAGGASSDGTFSAGVYALSEQGPEGYSTNGFSCVGGTQSGASISLALGESATCTITNNDDAPSLTLVKTVINDNGGTLGASAWTLTADGPTPISGNGGAASGANFSAGSYALSETGPFGYAPSGWTCVGGTQSGASISLALGESATCTIVNDDIQPLLTLVKDVVNDNGGLLTVGEFPLFVDNTGVVSGAITGFDAGSYVVSETNQAGYEAGTWTGDCAADGSIDLALGMEYTCTVVNDDIPPELTIVKTAITPITIPGAELEYEITVSNIGGGDALGVTLTDALPPAGNPEENLPVLPWTTSTAGCEVQGGGATLFCDIGTLAKDPTPDLVASGDEASFTVSLQVIVPDDYLDPIVGEPGGSGTLGSNFEIDGNLTDEAGTSGLD